MWGGQQHSIPNALGPWCPLAQAGLQAGCSPWHHTGLSSSGTAVPGLLRDWAWEGGAEQPGREEISYLAPRLLLLFFSSLKTTPEHHKERGFPAVGHSQAPLCWD